MLARYTVTLDIAPPPEQIRVAMDVAKVVLAPGEGASLTLRLSDALGRPVAGEVALFAVDKAMLAVRPHPARNLTRDFSPVERAESLEHVHTYEQLVSPAGLDYSRRALENMLAVDPWLDAAWPLTPQGTDVEQPLAAVLAAHATDITDMPSGYDGGSYGGRGGDFEVMAEDAMEGADVMPMDAVRPNPMIMSRAAPTGGASIAMAATAIAAPSQEKMMRSSAFATEKRAGGEGESSEGGAGGSTSVAVKVRSAFETTPLFLPRIPVDASGRATITWTLPDNTGAYELRAYAAAAASAGGLLVGSLGGGATAVQLVRKRVTLDASIPRVARVGDTFRCGVTATSSAELPAGTTIVATIALRPSSTAMAAASAAATAASEATVASPLELLGSTEQTVRLGPLETRELLFKMRAAAIGEATLVAAVREVLPSAPGRRLDANSMHGWEVEPPTQEQPSSTSSSTTTTSSSSPSTSSASSDAIELKLPILGLQPEAVVATSMALRVVESPWAGRSSGGRGGADGGGGGARIWPEAIRLPAALPGSGTLSIGASAGRLASVRVLARGLLSLPAWGDEPYATALLGCASAATMLAPYATADAPATRGGSSGGGSGSGSGGSGGGSDGGRGGDGGGGGGGGGGSSARATVDSHAETNDAISATSVLPKAAAALASMTGSSNGLHFSASALGSAPPDSVDLPLNALGLLVLRRMWLARVPVPAALAQLGSRWRSALESGLVRTVEEAIRRDGKWSDVSTLAVCRLALGSGWEPTWSSAGYATREALSMRALEAGVDSLSTYAKAAYALALMLPADPSDDADPNSAPWLHRAAPGRTDEGSGLRIASVRGADPRVVGVLRYFASCLRVTARSAYLARSLSSWDAASPRDTALALSALAIGGATGAPPEVVANLDKLANHVASGGFQGGSSAAAAGGGVISGGSLLDGIALADYDGASSSLAADVRLRVLTGALPLYDARLRAAESAEDGSLATKTLSWAQLPPPPAPPLVFLATGVGEASVALSMRFVPSAVHLTPVYRGIEVAKIIQRHDALLGRPVGPPLSSIPLGAVVTVTIQLTSPDELASLVVEDWLPAGLEAIDPNANGGASGASTFGRGSAGHRAPLWPWLSGCMWWWRCTRWSRQTRKDALSFHASWAHAGTHTLSYEAIATTRGVFTLPPSKAYAALQPEVMGLSEGGGLTVSAAGEDLEPLPRNDDAHAHAHASRRSCPYDCSGRGACDDATGTCLCIAEAAGEDCTATRIAPTIGAVNANDSIAVLAGSHRPHLIELPVSVTPPLSPAASSSAAASASSSSLSSSTPAPHTPSITPKLSYLYALSSDEAVLPSSALALSAQSTSVLVLSVTTAGSTLPIPAGGGGLRVEGCCVRVTVAASVDGLLFGSRVVALWLHTGTQGARDSEEAIEAAADCIGDGIGYVPPSWDAASGFIPPLLLPSARGGGPAFGTVGGLSVLAVVLVLIIAQRVRARQRWRASGMRQLGEYPDPTVSPPESVGSQSGCYGEALPGAETPATLVELAQIAEVAERHGLRQRASPV